MKGKSAVNRPQTGTARFKRIWNRDKYLYLLCLPAILYLIIFDYIPMYGVQIAFRNYKAKDGIWGSEWVGLKYFIMFVNSPRFWVMLKNTLIISFYSLVAGFPIPIFLALLLNQCQNLKFKKTVQTVLYAPHFISMVVMIGMVNLFLSPTSGIINHILSALGLNRINFMGSAEMFPHIYVWSGVWQNAGWGTIIYISALAGINPELYEAAKMDGAGKFKMIRYIDIPSIAPTMATLLILNVGSIMNIGFQKAHLMQNAQNLRTSEIISTYVYKVGLEQGQFSFSTAINLFNTLINIILLVVANKVTKKLNQSGLF